jgi:hypothetical protein
MAHCATGVVGKLVKMEAYLARVVLSGWMLRAGRRNVGTGVRRLGAGADTLLATPGIFPISRRLNSSP